MWNTSEWKHNNRFHCMEKFNYYIVSSICSKNGDLTKQTTGDVLDSYGFIEVLKFFKEETWGVTVVII